MFEGTKGRITAIATVSSWAWAISGVLAENIDPPKFEAAGSSSDLKQPPSEQPGWNWHVQNTDILQAHPSFHAPYSGPISMNSSDELKETVSFDLFLGARLWRGAEFHVDGLVWQGFGLGNTRGAEGFPNGEAFRLGTTVPNINPARAFLRQTVGLGGDQETVEDDALNIAGKRDISRVTLTAGRFSAKDIFDNNSYANDPRTQFLNWSLMANEAWDYPADSLGYITGVAIELNEPGWAARYGFSQVPRVSNGMAVDRHLLEAWGMVAEFEKRFTLNEHPGAVRFLSFLNRAHMGSYEGAVDNPARPADIVSTRAYRSKFGFGLNVEQEFCPAVGGFLRLGWSDGKTEGWTFADVDQTATLGLSVKGNRWHRPNDTFALAGALNGISGVHQRFLAAGGTGILAGDGALSYGLEQVLESYYDLAIWKTVHATLDYQFIANPAFNRDRGPINIVGARLHWSY